MTLFSLFSIVAVSCSVTCDGCYRKQLDVTDARPSKCVSEALTLWRPALMWQDCSCGTSWTMCNLISTQGRRVQPLNWVKVLSRFTDVSMSLLQNCLAVLPWIEIMKSYEIYWNVMNQMGFFLWCSTAILAIQGEGLETLLEKPGSVKLRRETHHFGGWFDAAKLGVSTPLAGVYGTGFKYKSPCWSGANDKHWSQFQGVKQPKLMSVPYTLL